MSIMTLRELRKLKGLTQTDVALAIGFRTASGYHMLESNKRKYFQPEIVKKLAAILGVSVSEVMACMGRNQ